MSLVPELRERVESRMRELQPAVDEYAQLQRIAASFEDAARSPDREGSQASRASRARQRSSTSPRKGTTRSGAPRRGKRGDRAGAVLDVVAMRPGISVQEVAAEMGIGTTYLYRILPRLEREGKVRKEGRGYHLVAS